ncbi:UNVERIFIED_CONTAM: 7-deoxyloganetin glucosyltransferase [Sesamum radiatum]|uniref:7-deoxyloganetin glucosyltransferase n=1 Tax=Sesamum radiatum TaxID=300843 RepID=A0AAW2M302_SESRA
MICWPFFAEQQTNCWYCCTKWNIGMEIDSDVKRTGWDPREEVDDWRRGPRDEEKGHGVEETCTGFCPEFIFPESGESYQPSSFSSLKAGIVLCKACPDFGSCMDAVLINFEVLC